MSDRVMFLKVKRAYSNLQFRTRVGLCELPLALLVAVIAIIAAIVAPSLLVNPLFLGGLLLHAALLAAAFLIPWEKFREGSYVAIPLLDFVAISLTRNGAADVLPGLSLLAIFPVIWLSASGMKPSLSLLSSFAGPYLILGVAPLLGLAPPAQFGTAVLLSVAMGTVWASLRFASMNSVYSQRKLEASKAEVDRLQGENNERELLLEAILDTIDVGLVALDADGNRTHTNRQQRSYDLLIQAGNTNDDGASHLYAADKTTPVGPARYPVQRGAAGETFANYLVWLGSKDNQRAVSTAATAMKDGDGRFTGSVIVSNDVTDMVEALSAKEDFVSNVSHELWTPLTSIIGHLDLVLDDDHDLPQNVTHQLSVARRNAERLYALVSNLLASASGAASVHLRPTDLTGLVEHSIESAWPQTAGTGVTLTADVPDILWTTSDPLRIRQVLDNLISNAIKYSPDGGTVTVRARQHSDAALLEVQDTGIGMSPNETTQVFGKFFRTTAARESSIPGVGLGLSITKAIVDSHGGTIRCSSQPGAGTTFTVTLPLHQSEQN
ncbi:sensor histidine kinase [Arthrobacter tumbae]|uniref:sensor histidine kinase n=1 Tax=Arthrobacter tumbae TaxID=163874 RepID=UPI0027DD27E1|nr:HAMP domain-containing sensor histidine kinase [Arthrobacter tumbae]MBM7780356.1 signal transduction histidine kinase [Arthrobacter tumbae]